MKIVAVFKLSSNMFTNENKFYQKIDAKSRVHAHRLKKKVPWVYRGTPLAGEDF